MCKLMVGIRTSETTDEKFREVILAQESALKLEKDGIGALIVTKDNKIKIWRSVDDYDKILASVYNNIENAKLVAIHTRTRTVGEVDIKNVHFFEDRGYVFAHNGVVSKYSSSSLWNKSTHDTKSKKMGFKAYEIDGVDEEKGKTIEEIRQANYDKIEEKLLNCAECIYATREYCKAHKQLGKNFEDLEAKIFSEYDSNGDLKSDAEKVITVNEKKPETTIILSPTSTPKSTASPSDSLQFLRNLELPATVENLHDAIEADSLWGITFLLNKETLEAFFSVRNKNGYMLTDNETFSFLFSYEPEEEVEITKYSNICGVDVVVAEEKVELKIPKYDVCEGVYKLNLSQIDTSK